VAVLHYSTVVESAGEPEPPGAPCRV